MRLFEITTPDPAHARLAQQVAGVYRKLYTGVMDAMRRFPPRGAEVLPERQAIVFRYEDLVGHDTDVLSPKTFEKVAEVLRRLGWTTDRRLYREGLARRTEVYVVPDTPRVRRTGGVPGERVQRVREMSIGRILENAGRDQKALAVTGMTAAELEELKKAFENDPSRRGTAAERRGQERVVVISFDPVEVAHITAGRGWKSCWRIGGAEEWAFRESLECGIAAAWLTTRDDIQGPRWIDSPTARWLVVPYLDPRSRSVVLLRPVFDREHVYGTPPSDADRAVSEALRRVEESLARFLGELRVGQIAVPWFAEKMPQEDVLFAAGDPARPVYLALGADPAVWEAQLRPEDFRGLDAEKIVDAAERLAKAGALPEAARELAEVVRSPGKLPQREEVLWALLLFAAFGVLPERAVPPPEARTTGICRILRAIGKVTGESEATVIRRIWTGENAEAASLLALIDGCLDWRDPARLPTAETAIGIAERILRRTDARDRFLAGFLEALRSGGKDMRSLPYDLRPLAWRILLTGRAPRDVKPYEAAAAPLQVLAVHGGRLPPDIELLARVAGLAERVLHAPQRARREVTELKRRYGREAILAALRKVVEEGSKVEPTPEAVEHARDVLAAVEPGRLGTAPESWKNVKAVVDAGLAEPVDLLRGGTARRKKGHVDDDEYGALRDLPGAAKLALLLNQRAPLSPVVATLGDVNRREVVDALRSFAEHAPEDLAPTVRVLLGAATGRGRIPHGSDAVPAAVMLALAGVIRPEQLTGALDAKQWREIARAAENLREPKARDRLLDVLARSRPVLGAVGVLPPGEIVELARRTARYGVEPEWGPAARKALSDPLWGPEAAAFVAAYEDAGGRVPEDLRVSDLDVLATAVDALGGRTDVPVLSGWIAEYARDLAEEIEERGLGASTELARLVYRKPETAPLVRAVLRAMPKRIANRIRSDSRKVGSPWSFVADRVFRTRRRAEDRGDGKSRASRGTRGRS